jgi:PAS domain S-box-containing protein
VTARSPQGRPNLRETRMKGSEAPAARALRVLLVEDSENDALLLLRELRRCGYWPLCERVCTPEDMERALKAADARAEPFQVVISDYYMPRFRAPEALELLRELGYDAPFIVVSGKIGEDAAVGVMKAGADDYLTKENMSRLCPAIERELREAEVRRERERAEKALGRSEDRFRRLVEQAADAIFVHDLEGKIVDVNRQACESLGYSREELLSMSVSDVEANYAPGSLKKLWSQITSGPPRTLEGIHRRKDSTTFPVEVRVGVFEAEEHPLMLALVRDVSERREAERKIRETEARYRTLVEQIPAVTYVQEPIESDNPKAITYMSPQYESMLGYPPEKEVLDEEHWLRVLHPDDRDRVLAEEVRSDETGEPFRVEYRQIARDGRVVWVRDEATLVRDEEGNPLYWLGVQYDITEQKRTEEELRRSEERSRATFEQAAVGIVQVGLDGEWLRYNDKLCDILGYTREELEVVSVFDLISPEDVEKDYDRGVSMLAGELRDYTEEKLIVGKEGRRVWINLTVSLVHDDADEPRYFIAVVEDIGKRKQAEADLRLRDRAVAASSNGIVITDPNLPDNPVVYVNPAFERITGYSAEEVRGRNCRFMQGDDDRDQPALAELREALREGRYSRVVLRNRRKDGTPFWNELSVSPVRDEAGRLTHFVGVQNDVTERQRTQEELRQSEERFKVLAQEVVEGIVLIENGRIIDANRSVTEMFGYEFEELIGMKAMELTLPENREMVGRRIADEDTTVYESEGLKKDGTIFPIEIRPRHLPYSGRRIRVTSIIDLTERKRAEEALIMSEERYRAVVEQSMDGIYLLDAGTRRILETNPALREMLGYSATELRGMEIYDLAAHSREDLDDNVQRTLAEGARIVGERKYRRKDGSVVEVEVGVSVISYSGMEVICAVLRDITERKRAEARYRTLVEQLPVVTYMQDIENAALAYVSPQIESVLGYSPEEYLENPNLRSLTIHPEDRGWVLEEDARTDETGEPYSVEYRRISRDGRVLWVREEAVLVRDSEGRPLFWQGILIDVTERKHQEEALRQSEALYRTVIEQAAENIFLVDAKTRRVLEANDALHRSLGYTAEELKEMTLYDIVAHDQESIDVNIERIMDEKQHSLGERQYRRKDGSLADVEVNVSAVPYDGGKAMCVVAHDVTERKQAERALEEIREAERNRIARELHDSTLQDIVYALQEVQVMQVIAGDEVNPALEDTAEALRRSVEGLRGAIFELRLKETLTRSLAFSLENLMDLNRRMARGRYQLELIVDDDFPARLPDRTGQELTRLVQEALTNVRRHAEARRVRVELGLEGEIAYVQVSDDGRGFDAANASTGIGQQSMSQRAHQLGGELSVESAPGKGTRVRFLIPVSRLVEG